MQQPEVGKSVLGFLGCCFAEEFGELVMAEGVGYIGKEEIFAVGHALAAKGGFEIGASRGCIGHSLLLNWFPLQLTPLSGSGICGDGEETERLSQCSVLCGLSQSPGRWPQPWFRP